MIVTDLALRAKTTLHVNLYTTIAIADTRHHCNAAGSAEPYFAGMIRAKD